MNWHEMEYAIIQLFVFLVFCGTGETFEETGARAVGD